MFGPSFIDSVKWGRREGSLRFGDSEERERRSGRIWGWILGLSMLILAGRLIQLQAMEGERNRQVADEQRIRLVQIPAARGLIVDRNDKPLVQNVPLFRKVISDPKLGVMLESIERDEALALEAEGRETSVVEGVARDYLYGGVTAHVLGYLSEVSGEEITRAQEYKSTKAQKKEDCIVGYQLGDLVGRTGVEEAFDCLLRGENGVRLVEVDTAGRLVRQVGSKPAVAGRRLKMYLDIELQQAIMSAMEGKVGAVVVSRVPSGEVIAMVSSPSYDPGVFSPKKSTDRNDAIMELFSDEKLPLVNRAIAATYPPGSTFKIVTAAGGLEMGKIDESYMYEDTGVVSIGSYQYRNWYMTQYGRSEGQIGVKRALSRSTDTFFYKVGELVGADGLQAWGEKFGLGTTTGVGVGGELAGLVPGPEWKLKTIGERWFLGNTYHMAIGQGDLLTTPIQVNAMTGVIAGGGKWCRPRLVMGAPEHQNTRTQEQETCRDLNLKKETLQLIKDGMVGACSPGGTAFPLFNFVPQVACKTGTAEFGPVDEKGHRKTHAWLTGFAPADNPEVVVTVLLEEGGEGSRDAAPVARVVLDKWKEIGKDY